MQLIFTVFRSPVFCNVVWSWFDCFRWPVAYTDWGYHKCLLQVCDEAFLNSRHLAGVLSSAQHPLRATWRPSGWIKGNEWARRIYLFILYSVNSSSVIHITGAHRKLQYSDLHHIHEFALRRPETVAEAHTRGHLLVTGKTKVPY